jgi:predicted phosphodiesterase
LIDYFQGLPFFMVFGNNDDYVIPEIRRKMSAMTDAVCLEWGDEVELGGRRIAMTHGHLTTDIQRLLKSSPDYLFTGHSHVPGDWKVGTTRRINPGALHRAKSFSIATLDLDTDRLQFIDVPR